MRNSCVTAYGNGNSSLLLIVSNFFSTVSISVIRHVLQQKYQTLCSDQCYYTIQYAKHVLISWSDVLCLVKRSLFCKGFNFGSNSAIVIFENN